MTRKARNRFLLVFLSGVVAIAALFLVPDGRSNWSHARLLFDFGTVGEAPRPLFACYQPRALVINESYVVASDRSHVHIWESSGSKLGAYSYRDVLPPQANLVLSMPAQIDFLALNGSYLACAGMWVTSILLMDIKTAGVSREWCHIPIVINGTPCSCERGIAAIVDRPQHFLALGNPYAMVLDMGNTQESLQVCPSPLTTIGDAWDLSRNGLLVACVSGNRVTVYNMHSSKIIASSRKDPDSYRSMVEAIALSPTGTEIAVGETDNTNSKGKYRETRSIDILSYPSMELADRFEIGSRKEMGVLRRLAYNDAGDLLLFVTSNGIVTVYDRLARRKGARICFDRPRRDCGDS